MIITLQLLRGQFALVWEGSQSSKVFWLHLLLLLTLQVPGLYLETSCGLVAPLAFFFHADNPYSIMDIAPNVKSSSHSSHHQSQRMS